MDFDTCVPCESNEIKVVDPRVKMQIGNQPEAFSFGLNAEYFEPKFQSILLEAGIEGSLLQATLLKLMEAMK